MSLKGAVKILRGKTLGQVNDELSMTNDGLAAQRVLPLKVSQS
jgi:hypothetical protein